MMSSNLSDAEASRLLLLPKYLVEPGEKWYFPDKGQRIEIELRSIDDSERFMLRAEKSRYKIEKVSYGTRVRRVIMLVRLDLDPDGRHMNPDGTMIHGPHLHLYRESSGDQYAIPVPQHIFPDVLNRADCWYQFLKYCNVTQLPDVRFNLFS